MSRILVLLALIFGLSSVANAQEFALSGGFRNNNADTNIALARAEPTNGIQFGALGFFPLISPFVFRTGFLYTQRYSEITYTNGNHTEVNFAYMDIPLTFMLKLGDYAGVFAGPILAINQSSDCIDSDGTSCKALQVKSSIMPLVVGVNFKFAPQMGGELFAEFYSGDLAQGLSNMKAMGGNFVFYFE